MTTDTDATSRPGLDDQTFLVGDLVYIRAVDPADAEFGTALAASTFPKSTAWLENWIKEELPKAERTGYYVIVRKRDNQPIGRLTTNRYEPVTRLYPWIDPLLGEQGDPYLAEAMRLVVPWLVDEQHRPNLRILVTSNQTRTIVALDNIGARLIVRFREMFRVWGGRADGLFYEYLNPHWIERLGDPAAIDLPRSGTGEPRPVQTPVIPQGDPPTNAVRIGERVYLRPLTKADYEQDAHWSLRDPETFWDAGRWPASAIAWAGIEERNQKEERPDWVRFAVCLRESDEVIGALGITDINYLHGFADTESAMFRPDYRGGGYGTEAKQLLIDYAFNTLNLHTIQSFVIFPNTRSAAALRKQGYQEAGRAHWEFSSFGTFENFVVFELLAADWRALPRVASGDRVEEGGA
jgi:RimJ/RimL family protein N-acetyltransferase